MAMEHAPVMRIHSRWYNMQGFQHPGGPIMLSLGVGRDATALFESHHPFTSRERLANILAKYETKEKCVLMDAEDTGAEFSWPAPETKEEEAAAHHAPISPFAVEMTTTVKAYFEAEAKRRNVPLLQAIKATRQRWLELFLYVALFLATMPAFVSGQFWTLFATPLTYWIMGVNVFHDASHFALSRNWVVNALGTYTGWYFSSALEWYHQHVIGHHCYPNIPRKDPDLYHNGTMERHTRTLKWRKAHTHQPYSWLPIWWIGTFAMSFLKPIQMFLSGRYNRSVTVIPMSRNRIILHFLGRILVFGLCHVLPFFILPFGRAFLFASVPVGFVSLCFMLSSQVNHLTDQNIDVASDDFYAHQVITSHTLGVDSYLTFMFTGGLNMQTEHHLFPTVNHCHLKNIQPIVKSICLKHGVKYHESATLWEAFGKYIKHLVTLSKKPVE